MTTPNIHTHVAKSDPHFHRDSVNETGEAYSQFQGWVLQCQWCYTETRGQTKAEALVAMQRHFDRFAVKIR